MPFLTDENRIAELRKQFPTLTHTSWKELPEIEPKPNVDKYHAYLGRIVCATSSDRDFYALRCNERQGMINYSIPYRGSDGKINRIFIFEKMKDTYYEHVVSSENFIPIVSEDSEKGDFSGEWAFQPKANDIQTIKPISIRVGHKDQILKKTSARVFTICDMKCFKEKVQDDSFVAKIGNLNTSLEAVTELVVLGILKAENKSKSLKNILSKCAENGKNVAQEDSSKTTLSLAQQAVLNARKPQH